MDAFADAAPEEFLLDPTVAFLNHGSFGALPRAVFEAVEARRRALESEPVHYLAGRLPALIDEARAPVAAALGASPADVVFARNATSAVNGILGSVALSPGDEILTTNHRYDAVGNTLHRAAARTGARVVEARVPFPLQDPAEITAAIVAEFTDRTRLLVLDHISSVTALIFPVADITAAARARGVPVLIDGAHVPGHLPVDVPALGADWWTGNLHKWAFAPRGTAALWVAPSRHAQTLPTVTSHGIARGLHAAWDWTGTDDPTPWLTAPNGLAWHAAHGGVALMAANHERARQARALVAEGLGLTPPHPDRADLYGAMATLPLPIRPEGAQDFHDALFDRYRVEIPVMAWSGRGWMRLSAQIYNVAADYERLVTAVRALLG